MVLQFEKLNWHDFAVSPKGLFPSFEETIGDGSIVIVPTTVREET